MDSTFPSITISFYHFWLSRNITIITIFDILIVYSNLPITTILDAIRRIKVNTLHLAFHPFTIQQRVHHQKAVTLNHSVLPVVTMLVVTCQALQLIFLCAFVVAKEVELHLGAFALVLMQFIETVDDSFRANVLMLVQATDVCSQLGHTRWIVFIVVLVLAEPVEFRVASALELMAEDVVLALFRLPADSHLLFALMGTIWNGCTFVTVMNTADRSVLICFHIFYEVFICRFESYMYFCGVKQKNDRIMTALQMNAELFRELSIIAEDESLMQKALKYLKKLTAKKQAMDETEYIMSSPAMVDILRQGDEDIKNGRGRVVTLDEIWK